jgi:predicted Zn-dependent protease
MDAYMNFTYMDIYYAANDREGYRQWVNRTLQMQDRLPPLFEPMIEMELARLAIWDDEFDVAIAHLDRASGLLDQSLIQVFQNNLGMSSVHVTLADLYLKASAIDDARERIEGILKVFPANGHAKLVSARIYLAQGNEEAGREALVEALEIWSGADTDFIYGVEARSLMKGLELAPLADDARVL